MQLASLRVVPCQHLAAEGSKVHSYAAVHTRYSLKPEHKTAGVGFGTLCLGQRSNLVVATSIRYLTGQFSAAVFYQIITCEAVSPSPRIILGKGGLRGANCSEQWRPPLEQWLTGRCVVLQQTVFVLH